MDIDPSIDDDNELGSLCKFLEEEEFEEAIERFNKTFTSIHDRTSMPPERVTEIVTSVLNRVRDGRDTPAQVEKTLQCMAKNIIRPPIEVTEQLLELMHIPGMTLPVIHGMPKMMLNGGAKGSMELIFNSFLEILETDRAYAVPLIGSLSSMVLPNTLQSRTLEICLESLSIAEENDFPTIVKTLMTMITASNGRRTVNAIRKECRDNVTGATLFLLLEIMGNGLRVNSMVLSIFIKSISNSTTPLSLFDLLLLILLWNRPMTEEVAETTFIRAAKKGMVTLEVLKTTCNELYNSKSAGEVYLMKFMKAIYALPTVSIYEGRVPAELASDLISWSADISEIIFIQHQRCRQEAINLMLHLTTYPEVWAKSSSNGTGTNIEWSKVQMARETMVTSARSIAKFACNKPELLQPYGHIILEWAVRKTFVIQDFTTRTYILDILCNALVTLSNADAGMNSLIMIMIQKQLFSPKTLSQYRRRAAELNKEMQGKAKDDASQDHAAQMAIVTLATHLLANGTRETSRDSDRLVEWILRTLPYSEEDAAGVIYSFFRIGLHRNSMKNFNSTKWREQLLKTEFPRILRAKQAYAESDSGALQINVVEFYASALCFKKPGWWESILTNIKTRDDVVRARIQAALYSLKELVTAYVALSSSQTTLKWVPIVFQIDYAHYSELQDMLNEYTDPYKSSFLENYGNEKSLDELVEFAWTLTISADVLIGICKWMYSETCWSMKNAVSSSSSGDNGGHKAVLDRIFAAVRQVLLWRFHARLVCTAAMLKIENMEDDDVKDDITWTQSILLATSSYLTVDNSEQSLYSTANLLHDLTLDLAQGLCLYKDSSLADGEDDSIRSLEVEAALQCLITQLESKYGGRTLHRLWFSRPVYRQVFSYNASSTDVSTREEKLLSRFVPGFLAWIVSESMVKCEELKSLRSRTALSETLQPKARSLAQLYIVVLRVMGQYIDNQGSPVKLQQTIDSIGSLKETRHNAIAVLEVIEAMASGTAYFSNFPMSRPDIVLIMDVLYQWFMQQWHIVEDSVLSCLVLRILLTMTRGTQKTPQVARIVVGTLNRTYPLEVRQLQEAVSPFNIYDASASLALLKGRIGPDKAPSSVTRYYAYKRFQSQNMSAHVRYCVVTIWSILNTEKSVAYLGQLTVAMENVINSCTKKARKRPLTEDAPIEAVEGEHLHIKNMHLKTVWTFFDAVVHCCRASIYRVCSIGFTSNTTRKSSLKETEFEQKCGPYSVLISAIIVYQRLLRLLFRSLKMECLFAPIIILNPVLTLCESTISPMEMAVKQAIEWRSKPSSSPSEHDLKDLKYLIKLFDEVERWNRRVLNLTELLKEHGSLILAENVPPQKKTDKSSSRAKTATRLHYTINTFQAVLGEEQSKLSIPKQKKEPPELPSWDSRIAIKSFDPKEILSENQEAYYSVNVAALDLWNAIPEYDKTKNSDSSGAAAAASLEEEAESSSDSDMDDYDSDDELMMHFTSKKRSSSSVAAQGEDSEDDDDEGFSTLIIQCKK